jgi:hypothetical protein
MGGQALCSFASGESDREAAGGRPCARAGYRKVAELGLHLASLQHAGIVLAAEVQQPDRCGVEQVIADQAPARAEDAHGLGQGLVPGDDVVQHRGGQHEAEPVVVEGKGVRSALARSPKGARVCRAVATIPVS